MALTADVGEAALQLQLQERLQVHYHGHMLAY